MLNVSSCRLTASPVRRVGLGAMRLTDATGDGSRAGARIWRAPEDPASAIGLLRRAVELGVQLIDTADAYALGQNEELIAEAPHPCPDNVVVTTKVGTLASHRRSGFRSGTQAICVNRPSRACDVCASTRSICSSFTEPIRRIRSPSRCVECPAT